MELHHVPETLDNPPFVNFSRLKAVGPDTSFSSNQIHKLNGYGFRLS